MWSLLLHLPPRSVSARQREAPVCSHHQTQAQAAFQHSNSALRRLMAQLYLCFRYQLVLVLAGLQLFPVLVGLDLLSPELASLSEPSQLRNVMQLQNLPESVIQAN